MSAGRDDARLSSMGTSRDSQLLATYLASTMGKSSTTSSTWVLLPSTSGQLEEELITNDLFGRTGPFDVGNHTMNSNMAHGERRKPRKTPSKGVARVGWTWETADSYAPVPVVREPK